MRTPPPLQACLASLLLTLSASAATPPGGTLSPENPVLTYTAGPFLVSNPTGLATSPPLCSMATPCDDFALTVSLPTDYAVTHPNAVVIVQIAWPSPLPPNRSVVPDFDLYVLDASGQVVGTSATSGNPEVVILPAGSGMYRLTVRVVPFAVAGDSFTGIIRLSEIPSSPPGAGIPPRYQNYPAPPDLGNRAGEPTIGVNWKTGNVLYQAILETLRVRFDDSTSPAQTVWRRTGSQITSMVTFDPILFTDVRTGRTFVSQLTLACSLMAFTDDDGENWTPSQGCGVGTLFDRQTVGGGPYAPFPVVGRPQNPIYPDTVYYCAQDVVSAACARSDDGGLTFGPGIPIYDLTQCGGLHGHIKVAPDGTAYVPNRGCNGRQAVVVSEDNGTTWEVRPVPGSTPSGSDPSVAIASDGTVYFCYVNGDGHPHVAVSRDRGRTWLSDQDVGTQVGVQGAVFPAAVAGDPDRAACAFLGTTTPGNFQDSTNFRGVWHLYVAHTFDGGRTWLTVDATPDDPVQVGSICLRGVNCGEDRNLLDFMDAAIDAQGRVLVAYADGCIGTCVDAVRGGSPNPNLSRSAKATIARQSGGRRMFAAFDPVEPSVPAAPLLQSAFQDGTGVHLSWLAPDDGGSPITNYRIYRGTTSGGETLLTTTPTAKTTFDDSTALPGVRYFYRVSAVNAVGEGPLSNEVASTQAPPPESPCRMPGVRVVADPAGDQRGAPADPQLDIREIFVAEPFFPDGSSQLVFTMRVGDLTSVPPNASWKTLFVAPNGTTYFVQMSTFDPTGVRFQYGHVEPGTVNRHVTDGPADPGSGFSPDGTITIVIANAKVGNPTAGQALANINGVTQALVGTSLTGGLLVTVDSTGSGSYQLVGNAACANRPPTAVLTATPTSGVAPLTVHFDGSASSDPDDTVASYTFDFGDGSPIVTQVSPTADHTYTAAGTYTAALTVTDSRGASSPEPARVTITVQAPPPPGPSRIQGGGYLDADGKVNFSFQVASDRTGHLSYNDHAGGIRFETQQIDSYATQGTCGTFTGTAVLKDGGGSIRYRVTACDNGEPGKGVDTFAIEITGAVTSSRSGPIAAGNIRFRPSS